MTSIIPLLLSFVRRSNDAFKVGKQLQRQLDIIIQKYLVFMQLDERLGITSTRRKKWLALIAEMLLTCFFLLPIVKETGETALAVKLAIAMTIYGVTIHFITGIAGKFLFASSSELILIQQSLVKLEGSTNMTEYIRDAKSKKWIGFVLAGLFLSILVFFNFLRNYIISKHVHWFSFKDPVPILLLIFSIIVGIILIYFSRFNDAHRQIAHNKKQKKNCEKKLQIILEDTNSFQEQIERLFDQAEQEALTIPDDDINIKMYMERMKSKSTADPHFFREPLSCSVRFMLFDKEGPLANALIECTTADEQEVIATSDEQGLARVVFQTLNLENRYLRSVSINGHQSKFNRFFDGNKYSLQVATTAKDDTNNDESTIMSSTNGQLHPITKGVQ